MFQAEPGTRCSENRRGGSTGFSTEITMLSSRKPSLSSQTWYSSPEFTEHLLPSTLPRDRNCLRSGVCFLPKHLAPGMPGFQFFHLSTPSPTSAIGRPQGFPYWSDSGTSETKPGRTLAQKGTWRILTCCLCPRGHPNSILTKTQDSILAIS